MYLSGPTMSANAITVCRRNPRSIPYCSFALSICRRLLMQVLLWEFVRARMKEGIAIVASIAITATTIIISIRVKERFIIATLFLLD